MRWQVVAVPRPVECEMRVVVFERVLQAVGEGEAVGE